jgi:glyoxylase-like metal-dependent hydrolase (beta-lactamase superfamily II)
VKFYRLDFGIHFAPQETAIRQIESLGIDPQEVKHIILTHAHFDHAGGLPDFPWAKVHLHRKEYEALQHPRTWIERLAYDPKDFSPTPDLVLYADANEKWFDFDTIALPFTPRIFLIPLFGHTSGHCGVVLETESGWLFQAADALPTEARFDLTPDWINRMVIGPHVPRLKAFAIAHPEVRLLAGHVFSSFFEK